MEDSTKFDSNKIEVLEGLEAVRRRPVMYLGDLASATLPARLLAQSMCHAVDEAVGGKPVSVSFDGTSAQRACVQYDAGMPLVPDASGRSVAVCFLTLLRACSNLKKNVDVGSVYCELGLAVLNASCANLVVEISHAGVRADYRFQRGALVHEQPKRASNTTDFTRMAFELDAELLQQNVAFDHARVRDLIRVRADAIPNLRVDLPKWD